MEAAYDSLYRQYEKLKDFWAQPMDGMWPLRPVWCPDISKPVLSADFITGVKKLTRCRRFTFEEFCQASNLIRFQPMRDAIVGRSLSWK